MHILLSSLAFLLELFSLLHWFPSSHSSYLVPLSFLHKTYLSLLLSVFSYSLTSPYTLELKRAEIALIFFPLSLLNYNLVLLLLVLYTRYFLHSVTLTSFLILLVVSYFLWYTLHTIWETLIPDTVPPLLALSSLSGNHIQTFSPPLSYHY